LLVWFFIAGKVRVAAVHYNTSVEESVPMSATGDIGHDRRVQERKNSSISQIQKRGIITTLITTIAFCVCCLPITFFQTGVSLKLIRHQASVTFGLASLAYLNVLLNPIIYAAHFDVKKKTFDLLTGLFTHDR
jgi:hypothetical protein